MMFDTKTLASAFFGSYFGYRFALLTSARKERLETYGDALELLTEYSGLLSRKESTPNAEPSIEFSPRMERVGIYIEQRFSKAAHRVWCGAQCFVTSDGRLPRNKNRYDFEEAKKPALAAMRAELSWVGRWGIRSEAVGMIRSICSKVRGWWRRISLSDE